MNDLEHLNDLYHAWQDATEAAAAQHANRRGRALGGCDRTTNRAGGVPHHALAHSHRQAIPRFIKKAGPYRTGRLSVD